MSVKPSAVMASAVFLSMFSRHRLASCGSSKSRAWRGGARQHAARAGAPDALWLKPAMEFKSRGGHGAQTEQPRDRQRPTGQAPGGRKPGDRTQCSPDRRRRLHREPRTGWGAGGAAGKIPAPAQHNPTAAHVHPRPGCRGSSGPPDRPGSAPQSNLDDRTTHASGDSAGAAPGQPPCPGGPVPCPPVPPRPRQPHPNPRRHGA